MATLWVRLVAAQNATLAWQRAQGLAPRTLITDEAQSRCVVAEISLRGAADAYRALRFSISTISLLERDGLLMPELRGAVRATRLMARAVRTALTWQCVRLVGLGPRQHVEALPRQYVEALDEAFDGELLRDEALLSQMRNVFFRAVLNSV